MVFWLIINVCQLASEVGSSGVTSLKVNANRNSVFLVYICIRSNRVS